MSSQARRCYDLLLRLLPPEFRQRWAADMADVLEARLDGASGPLGRTAVWFRAILDVAVFALRERLVGSRRAASVANPSLPALAIQDFKYAARTLLRSPGFTLVAIATLAVGVGASTATYSVVYPVLLEAPPYPDAEQLVVIWPEANLNRTAVGMAQDDMASLSRVSGLSNWSLTLTGTGDPIEITATLVSPQHFELLGVSPLLGRTFVAEHEIPANAGVVVLSYDFWVRAFGADPDILGQVIDLAGADHERREIIGVMPLDFRPIDASTEVWVPLQGDPTLALEEDTSWYVNTRIGRLAPGVDLEQANAEIRAHAQAVRDRIPSIIDAETAQSATVAPLSQHRARGIGNALWVALGAVFMVLLIACANLANLLLARGEARHHELAVRAALGAGRGRIGRLVLAETLLLGAMGGGLGVATAFGLVELLVSQAPADFPAIADVAVSTPVLGAALGATLLATVLAGLAPVLKASRADAAAALAGAARGATGSQRARLGTALIGVQVGLAVVVTVGSGLMLRSLGELLAVNPGLDPQGVVAFRPSPPAGRYPDGIAMRAYYDRVTEQVASLPGVESVGAIHLLPGTTSNWSFPTYPEGVEIPEGTAVPSVNFRATRLGYFRTVRIPLLAGRLLKETDHADSELVVLVNSALANHFWPGEDPLGKELRIFSRTNDPARVVGVVGNVRQHRRDMDPLPEMYYPHAQVSWNQLTMSITARFDDDEPLRRAGELRQAVWAVDADVPISDMQELSEVLATSTRPTRFLALLLSGFASISLALGAFGVFGVTSYTVGRRKSEFGVRLALGSSRFGLGAAAMGRSLLPVAVGLAGGIAGAVAASRLLESVLYGVGATDLATLVGVTLLLGMVAIAATLVPAWRASRVDPVAVLNAD